MNHLDLNGDINKLEDKINEIVTVEIKFFEFHQSIDLFLKQHLFLCISLILNFVSNYDLETHQYSVFDDNAGSEIKKFSDCSVNHCSELCGVSSNAIFKLLIGTGNVRTG